MGGVRGVCYHRVKGVPVQGNGEDGSVGAGDEEIDTALVDDV